jgi:exodeoxyribonuclease-3
MAQLRILSWNINSVRLRIDSLRRVVRKLEPDVVCLQEIKVQTDLFPRQALERMGFVGGAIVGQKGYHGVATFCRKPLDASWSKAIGRSKDARHVAVTVGGVEIHNIYLPAGGDVPDPEINPSFKAKLEFMRALARWTKTWPARPTAKRVLVGDLNVAPLETDVWSHQKLKRVVTHTPVEVAHFAKIQQAHPWVDVARTIVPPDQKLFTWWSYRSPDWRRQDKGRRLDHIWVSQALADGIVDFKVARDVRGWKRPSDHAPVMATLQV